MCNLNIIFKKNRTDTPKIAEYMNIISYISWQGNNDGEGFISLSKDGLSTDRSKQKFKYVGDQWFLSTHQRLATSGKNESNIHPHETEDLILQHNGIFGGMGNVDKSDTKEYAEKLQEEYIKKNKKSAPAVTNAARRQNIPAFRERGVWKIGENVKI